MGFASYYLKYVLYIHQKQGLEDDLKEALSLKSVVGNGRGAREYK